jgi:hypothetical protein
MPKEHRAQRTQVSPYPKSVAQGCLVLALLLPKSLIGCTPLGFGGADRIAGPMLSRYDWHAPAAHWRLPRSLKEISGLTHLDGTRLLAHDDNSSTLWTLAPEIGSSTTQPTLLGGQRGDPALTVEGDFEGVTTVSRDLYLLGSQGTLHRTRLDPPLGALTAGLEAVPSGVEGRCNFEGIAAASASGTLYLACKYPRQPRPGAILLFHLQPGSAEPPETLWSDVTVVLARTGLERLRPSGLAWLPGPERLLVLAGKERLILELDARGTMLAWRRLPRGYHRQAEGLSVSPGGDIVIADEANGRWATLTLYRSRYPGATVQPPGE